MLAESYWYATLMQLSSSERADIIYTPIQATASADRSTRVWDVRRGYCTHAFRGHESPLTACTFHPVPTRLLLFTASEDTTARVWSLGASACLAVLKCHVSAVTSLAVVLAPDPASGADALVLGGRDKIVSVWAVPQTEQKKPKKQKGSAAGDGDGHGFDKLATVLVHETVEAVLPVQSHAASTTTASAKSGGSGGAVDLQAVHFITAGDKGVIRLWCAANGGTCVASAPPDAVCTGPEAGFLALAMVSGNLSPPERGAQTQQLRVMATTSDGRLLFYVGGSGGGSKPRDGWRLTSQLLGNLDDVIDLRCLPSAADAAEQPAAGIVAVTNSSVVRVLDGTSLGCVASLEGHSDTVLCADTAQWPSPHVDATSSSTACVATGSKDRCLRLWRVACIPGQHQQGSAQPGWNVTCLGVSEGHAGAVTALACGPRTSGLVVTGSADKLIKLWDCSASLSASPPTTETGAAVGSTKAVLRVRAAVAAHDKEVNAIAISPNEQLLATGSADRTVKLWRMPALLPQRTLRGHTRGVWSVAFSPLDAVLVSGSADKSIRLWNTVDGSCLKALQGHTSGVLRVCWLTLGTQLGSAGADGCVKLWNVAAGECVWTGEGHDAKAWALASAADGQLLVSGGADGAIHVWRDATAERAEAAAVANEAAALADQQLRSAMASRSFGTAFRLGLQLARPGALFTLLESHFGGDAARDPTRSDEVVAALQASPRDMQARFLALCCEWNANAKTCHVAQRCLGCLFSAIPPGDVAKLPGARDLLPGVAAYTKRHIARLDRLVRATYVLDYTLSQQGVLLDDIDDDSNPAIGAAIAHDDAPWTQTHIGGAGALAAPRAPASNGHARQEDRKIGGDDDDFTAGLGLPGWGTAGEQDDDYDADQIGAARVEEEDAYDERAQRVRQSAPSAALARQSRRTGASTKRGAANVDADDAPPARPRRRTRV